MSWQTVGSPQSFTYVAKDIEGDEVHSFRFNGNEGNVTVHYRIFSKQLTGPKVRVRVQFDELEVHDDEEIGSGDWRIKTSVNNINCANSPEEHWSVGSGSSADLSAFRSVTVPVNSTLIVRCRVWEEDS
jgi:hypothetical protein